MQIPASGAYQPFVAPLWLSWYRPVPLFEPSPVRTPSFLYVVRGVAQLGLADYCPAPRRIDDIAGGRSAAGGCRVGVGFTWAVAVVGGRVVCGGSHGWRVAWVVAVMAVVGGRVVGGGSRSRIAPNQHATDHTPRAPHDTWWW